MKITIQKAEEQKPESKYPYFGIHKDGTLVYFTGHRNAILIAGNAGCTKVGEASSFYEDLFAPFNGTIKIEQ